MRAAVGLLTINKIAAGFPRASDNTFLPRSKNVVEGEEIKSHLKVCASSKWAIRMVRLRKLRAVNALRRGWVGDVRVWAKVRGLHDSGGTRFLSALGGAGVMWRIRRAMLYACYPDPETVRFGTKTIQELRQGELARPQG